VAEAVLFVASGVRARRVGDGAVATASSRDTGLDTGLDAGVAALVSVTASYRFQPRWLARVLWNRIATDYNRDTDVFLLGMGYRF